MTEIERLEKETELAATRLQTEQVAYRTAKMRLKEAKIAAGIIKYDDAVMKYVTEVREKAECFKSTTVKGVLICLCEALDGTNRDRLLDLDDSYAAEERSVMWEVKLWRAGQSKWEMVMAGSNREEVRAAYLRAIKYANSDRTIQEVKFLRVVDCWQR